MRNPVLQSRARRLARAIGLSMLLWGLLLANSASGQDPSGLEAPSAISEPVGSDQPIPKKYKSWSLFLVCNPRWVMPDSSDVSPEGGSDLRSLYLQFQAFGRTLGPKHVAVWFWSENVQSEGVPREIYTTVDVKRSAAFCAHLDLPPSEGPYVVVTTEYPGAAQLSEYPDTFGELENRYVLALNGMGAREAMEVLKDLANQIREDQLSETELGSEGYWRRWRQIFETLQSSLVGLSERTRVAFNTQFFTVELSPEG